MKFEITILGCGSATPTLTHNPTSQLINHHEHYFLFDCGEGTQLQLRRFGLKFGRINHIFITHLHGDHYFGLPGLLSTMHLLGRTTPLHIYSHEPLKKLTLDQLKVSHSHLRFELVWHEVNSSEEEVILETTKLEISSFPLNHKVPTVGFKINEKPALRNIRPECIEKYKIPIPRIRQIKAGADLVLEDGKTIPNSELTTDPKAPNSYAFCTDTAYDKRTVNAVSGVDLLYHEATFIEVDRVRAKKTSHSTAKDAARVAKEAGVKQLVLGHFSARYRREDQFLKEATEVFPNTILSNEGMKIQIPV